MNLYAIISLLFLGLIVFYDLWSRQIPLMLFLGELILSFKIGYNILGMSVLKVIILNFLILGFQIFILWSSVRLRYNKTENRLWSKFGKGDLFMLIIIAINLSPLNYLIFIMVVCIVSIIIWIGFSILKKNKIQTIPFAGFLAAGLIIIRLCQISGRTTSFYLDNFTANLIYGLF